MTLDALFARMASGAMYDDLSPELIEARAAAVRASDDYNASYGRPPAEREALLTRWSGRRVRGRASSRRSAASSGATSTSVIASTATSTA